LGFCLGMASFSDRIDIVAHFTIVPLVDGVLKVLYNLSAIVDNIVFDNYEYYKYYYGIYN